MSSFHFLMLLGNHHIHCFVCRLGTRGLGLEDHRRVSPSGHYKRSPRLRMPFNLRRKKRVHELRSCALQVGQRFVVRVTAAPGRIGTVAMTPIYQSLGTKEEKRA